jgi:putative DNA primase/helicase
MRERLKAEAGGAILAWIVAGVAEWRALGTAPPGCVRDLTAEYLEGEDDVGQWLDECTIRVPDGFERSSDLHKSFVEWCEGQGSKTSKSNRALSLDLVARGFQKGRTMVGRVFNGIRFNRK